MARFNPPVTDETYAAAQRWVDAALKRDDSLFTPGRPIWSPVVIADLWERFVDHPDTSSDDFLTKFRRQLAGDDPADPGTIQLAGECSSSTSSSPPTSVETASARSSTRCCLGRPEPVSIPADLSATLDVGLAAGGPGLGMARPFYLRYLLDFTRTWKSLPEARRDDALRDPWAFKDLAYRSTAREPGASARRSSISCTPTPSTHHLPGRKKQVADKFRSQVADPDSDQDKLLLQIRRHFEEQYGENVDYYDTLDVHRLWDPARSRPTRLRGDSSSTGPGSSTRVRTSMRRSGYKLEVAQRLRLTKDHLLSGDDGWSKELGKAFGPPNNLTAWRNHTPFVKWCGAQPEAAADVLNRIWSTDANVAESIDRFSRISLRRRVMAARCLSPRFSSWPCARLNGPCSATNR